MSRGWISRFKKSHVLEICTRPTCRGILGDGIRKKKFRPEVTKYRFKKINYITAVCKFEKKYFRLETIFWRKPSPRILR